MKLVEEIQPIVFRGGTLHFLDQTKLPGAVRFLEIDSAEACRDAIRSLVVRGAPAIGVAAAFGMLVESRRCSETTLDGYLAHMRRVKAVLASSRPTAVNLFGALDRVERAALFSASSASSSNDPAEARESVEREVMAIRSENEAICEGIGRSGQEIMKDGMTALTHCNAGILATGGIGTALAPIYLAHERGLRVRVFACETRPLLQGARLTAWELSRAGLDVTLITDSMAAAVMAQGLVDVCMVGCDRLAANGDAANKIGTYGLALLARDHGIPFYVACPTSTIDPDTPDGSGIKIEERDPAELSPPPGVRAYNPAFDVTPAGLITGIITEHGILRPPYEKLGQTRELQNKNT
ncbi:MAG: S-methyl-5-thioribose-1-phosphate isomerase [Synergistaceae bacterium]|jgi:methylthioribose-1-phosphate isomerase|nr:S-methyl-5-thioribose-1-phosphate isomerase [Synergistaceae bacterium]